MLGEGVGVGVAVGVAFVPVAVGVVVLVGVDEPLGEGDGVGVAVGVVVGDGGIRIGIPNPSNATYCGLFLAESLNVMAFLSLNTSTSGGLNTTSTSQNLPAFRGAPEHPSLCIANGDVATILLKVIEADLDLLVRVTVNGSLC